jgi:hypothetical protein
MYEKLCEKKKKTSKREVKQAKDREENREGRMGWKGMGLWGSDKTQDLHKTNTIKTQISCLQYQ